MKYRFSITAMILVTSIAAGAQVVASHAPTVATAVIAPTISAPPILGRPVAKVNGAILTDQDLLREMYAIFPYAKQHGGSFPKEMEPGIRAGALQMIIFEELAYQAAQKQGMTVSPERLNTAMLQFKSQFGSSSEYQQFLKSEFKGNEQLLRAKVRRSLLIEKYLKIEVDNKATVSPAELKSYYEKNPARFQFPESFAIQTISVIPPVNATPAQLQEAHNRAEDVYKQARVTKTAEEFGLLAEKVSDDDYRVMMGDHKWVERAKMPPQMLQPALKMKDGEVSELIQVDQNCVIFRLNRHIPAGTIKFEEVKVKLRKELEKDKTNQVRTVLHKKLQQNATVETL